MNPVNRLITPEEMQSYDRDGFLVVRGMYDPAQVRALSDAIDAMAARPPVVGGEMPYLEDSRLEPGKRILSRIEKFADHDPLLGALTRDEKMVGRLRELLGGEPVLFKEKVNFKLPGGAGFEPHQDIQPGWDAYGPFFMSVLVTIDESTIENGCLELAAGHHKRGLIGEPWKPLAGDQLRGIEFKHYPMSPGDVAFFDCFVPHQSKANLTPTRRRNLYLTYNRLADGDLREKYFADKRKNFPPDHEREPGKTYVFRV